MAATVLIRRAEVAGRIVDVACADGVVAAIGEQVAGGADEVLDAGGGALLPGLHDHHVHLLAMAAARRSIDVGSSLDALRDAPGVGWLRATGYHESVTGPLDRTRLDELVPDRPVRVQHRSGQLWVLNSAALRLVGHDDPDGRLYRADEWLRARLGEPTDDLAGDLTAVAGELAAAGVTGVSDLTPSTDPSALRLLAAAPLPLTVAVTGAPELADLDVGLPRGPIKVVLDEARLPPLDVLTTWFREARAAGRPIAVHCVSRVELHLALAAWSDVGAAAGDRIEHGAVIPLDVVALVRELGLTVVTQPSLVARNGDRYLAATEPDDRPHLWRCGSLLAAGVGVAGSSDAPYGDPDPWRGIAAAVDRRTVGGAVLGPDEVIPPARALDLYLTPLDDPAGRPRRMVAGAPADLCLLPVGLADALADPAAVRPAATFHGGRRTA